MEKLLGNTAVMIVLVSLAVMVIVFVNANSVIDKLYKKSMTSKEEIMRLLDLMFVDTTEKQVTMMLLGLSFGLGLLVFLLVWPNFWLGLGLGAVVTYMGWTFPLTIVKNLYDKRCNTLVDQMIDGLTIMSNGIKAGLSVPQSMERVVENMPNPISQEFNLVLSQVRMGRSVEEALLEFGERVPRPDVQMLVTAINILKETGGNLAETFTTIVTTIRERQKVERKIEAMTAQAMMQGLIVSLVPIGLIGLFFVIDRPFIMPMFTSTLGLVIFAVIMGLVIIGGITMRKVAKIDV